MRTKYERLEQLERKNESIKNKSSLNEFFSKIKIKNESAHLDIANINEIDGGLVNELIGKSYVKEYLNDNGGLVNELIGKSYVKEYLNDLDYYKKALFIEFIKYTTKITNWNDNEFNRVRNKYTNPKTLTTLNERRFLQAYLYINGKYQNVLGSPQDMFSICDGKIGKFTLKAKQRHDNSNNNSLIQPLGPFMKDSIPNELNINVDATKDTPRLDQKPKLLNETNETGLDEKGRNRENIQGTLNYINKYNKSKPSPLTVDMVKNALSMSINKKVINPVLAMSILFMESTGGIFTSRRSKKYPYGIYNVGNISCKEENQPKNYQEGLNMMIKHLNDRYGLFKECYPDNDPDPRHLLANVGPDGLGFMPNQENFRKLNTNGMGSYCASKNGQIGNLKYPYKISGVANKIEEGKYA